MKSINYIIILTFFVCTASCKKLIDVGPPKTLLTNDAAFSNKGGATTAILGIYNSLEGYNNVNTTTLPGLSADELISHSTPISRYYTNSLNANINDDFWSDFYKYIYQVNLIIEKVTASPGISEEDKPVLIAEATFLRAYFHFYLVNYFGDIPYITSSDYKINGLVERMPAKDSVYPSIIKDLLFAQSRLPEDYIDGVRTRANKGTATALLARAYLYNEQWELAEQAATTVIDDPQYQFETFENVFLTESQEAILQLSPNVSNFPFATEARQYILTNVPSGINSKVSLSDFLYNAFETGDRRKEEWIGTFTNDNIHFYHYAYKYKSTVFNPIEYSMVMRLTEQYLIRAEARAQSNNIDDAVDDLNMIRERANLDPVDISVTKEELLDIIFHERQVELFVEYGHRWLDLKRTGRVNDVMPAVTNAKGGTWKTSWQLYPIPQVQINTDPNMADDQNEDY